MPIKKKRKKSKNIGLSIFNIILFAMLISVIIITGIVIYVIHDIIAQTPEIDPTNISLEQNSQILAADGTLVEKVYLDGLRTSVKYEDISQDAINAFIAVEDKTFWEHEGFNFVRMIGAVKDSITGGGEIGGTSTITQQLARNIFLTEERFDRNIPRKIREAYYAMKIEDALEKEDIIATYLNTVYLGSSANGIEAASLIYFNKSAKDLNFIEGAMLAAVPKAPSYYQPMVLYQKGDVSSDQLVVGTRGSEYVYVYNPDCVDRVHLVLELMRDQGYITEEQYNEGINIDLASLLHPGSFSDVNVSSYFASLVKDQVIEDLAAKYDISEIEAQNRLLTGGYTIYSTLDSRIQHILDDTFDDSYDPELFGKSTESALTQFQSYHGLYATGTTTPDTWQVLIDKGYFNESVKNNEFQSGDRNDLIKELKKSLAIEGFAGDNSFISGLMINVDSNGNMVNSDYTEVLLYRYTNYFNNKHELVVPEYLMEILDNSSVKLKSGDLFYFNETDNGINASIRDLFVLNTNQTGYFYVDYFMLRKGGNLAIPSEFMKIDDEGNLIIDGSFINESENFSITEDGNLVVNELGYSIGEFPVVQPQVAVSVLDQKTGYLQAILGGRQVVGDSILNRATSPQMTGSAIKPIAIYGPALDSKIITAATPIDDIPIPNASMSRGYWPTNYNFTFLGRVNMRFALEDSINAAAVQVGRMIGEDLAVEYLEKNGISTLVKEGEVNDLNWSALALGGLTYGIPPVELASATGTFGNGGVHMPMKSYSKVVDSKGEVILDNEKTEGTPVFSPQAAYIMTDMLTDVVSYHGDANIYPGNSYIPVAGKTGTTGTTSQHDAVFVGYTPYYTSSVWIGNDIVLELTDYSVQAAKLFAIIMEKIHDGFEEASFERPDGIVSATFDKVSGKLPNAASYADPRGPQIATDLFIEGTQPTTYDDVHVIKRVCKDSLREATPFCPDDSIIEASFITRVDPDMELGSLASLIQDNKYVYHPGKCNIHTSSSITVSNNTTVGNALENGGGGRIVTRNIQITLKNKTNLILLRGTKIANDNTITLTDGSKISSGDWYHDSLGVNDYLEKLLKKEEEEKEKEEEEKENENLSDHNDSNDNSNTDDTNNNPTDDSNTGDSTNNNSNNSNPDNGTTNEQP